MMLSYSGATFGWPICAEAQTGSNQRNLAIKNSNIHYSTYITDLSCKMFHNIVQQFFHVQ